MFLIELFDRSYKIRPATNSYGLYNFVKGYEFNVGDSLFVCYLDAAAGPDKPNTLAFMRVNTDERKGSHALTHDNVPFKVFPAVVQCLRMFIQELNPPTIYMSGHDPKQHILYRKMLLHYADRIPAPYFLAERGDGALFISRDKNLSKTEGPRLQILHQAA